MHGIDFVYNPKPPQGILFEVTSFFIGLILGVYLSKLYFNTKEINKCRLTDLKALVSILNIYILPYLLINYQITIQPPQKEPQQQS